MTIKERVSAPTPPFWKRVQKISFILAGVSAAILTAPVSLPVGIVTVAGYIATLGTVTGALSQTAVYKKY